MGCRMGPIEWGGYRLETPIIIVGAMAVSYTHLDVYKRQMEKNIVLMVVGFVLQ